MKAYLNKIETAVPPHDVHEKFASYAPTMLLDEQSKKLFRRMADRSGIEHRYSFLQPTENSDQLDNSGFYQRGNFPSTEERMKFYEKHAFSLAREAMDKLMVDIDAADITHLIITTCTGFYAPGLDLQIVEHYGMKPSVERSILGFMGCYAAINGLKLARHIVRSDHSASVVILNLELCTIHLQETADMEQILSFVVFSDGCAASLITAEAKGIELEKFHCETVPDSDKQITWRIGEKGFDMFLSGQVPRSLAGGLAGILPKILGDIKQDEITYWAIHPGGRSVLDAVKEAISLPESAMLYSREILRRYGNMSSATIMFVLKEMLEAAKPGEGCAMAFGPGLTAETMRFKVLSKA